MSSSAVPSAAFKSSVEMRVELACPTTCTSFGNVSGSVAPISMSAVPAVGRIEKLRYSGAPSSRRVIATT